MPSSTSHIYPEWTPRPISRTCEFFGAGGKCGKPTLICYPAMGSGFMALCAEHGKKHLPQAMYLEYLIKEGFELEP